MLYHRRTFKRYLSHVFYVYSEASGAVAMLVAALLELACAAALGFDHPFAIIGVIAAAFFGFTAFMFAVHVYTQERKYNREVRS